MVSAATAEPGNSMPPRNDRVPWTPEQDAFLTQCSKEGLSAPATCTLVNGRFGLDRTVSAIRMRRTALGLKTTPNEFAQKGVPQPEVASAEQTVDMAEDEGGITIRAAGVRIKTLDDLLKHVKADLVNFEVDKPAFRKNEQVVRDHKGKLNLVEYFHVSCTLKRKAGPNVQEQVEAIIKGAFAKRKPLMIHVPKRQRLGDPELLQGIVIADPHIGKLAWGEGTGGENYDTRIAVETLRNGVLDVLRKGNQRDPGTRQFWLLGDYFHHDGLGMTTKGTQLDYDSRVDKMLIEGSEVLFDLLTASAEEVPTEVLLVPGNHDRVLTAALRRILVSEFRHHPRITVDDTFTVTKYRKHGACLLGFNHGEKGKKRLAEVMANKCAVEWGETTCREMHTGHLHCKSEIQLFGGVLVRTYNSLGPEDQWHADEQFVAAPRTIEALTYHSGGLMVGSDVWSPDLNTSPKRGTQ